MARASLVFALTAFAATAQSTERASVATTGAQGDYISGNAAISADGRFVAFNSGAENLVPGDTNARLDVFVRDRLGGTTERVSLGPGSVQGNGSCFLRNSISADGRYVAFGSYASNLVTGDTNSSFDIFVHDRLTGTTERANVDTSGAEANDESWESSMSADGRFVVFDSGASNLVPGDTNAVPDIFVRDRQGGTTERVSVATGGAQATGYSVRPWISADGRFVAFESAASNLALGDTNGVIDIFVHDRQNGTTHRVSLGTGGAQPDAYSFFPALSGDGRFVLFGSFASNLVGGDTNSKPDIFVRDLWTGTTERASVGADGAQGNGESSHASISADGRFVAFDSSASNLVSGDTNGKTDLFLRDRLLGTTERLSVDTGGGQADDYSWNPSISADGRFAAFQSAATNLVPGDTNGFEDVLVRDRGAPQIVDSCFGDGSAAACPCANSGTARHGCENSSGTGGAQLMAFGEPSLSADTLRLTSRGERPTALTLFLQGTELVAPVAFGDGLRCVGGRLERRLFVAMASGGVATVPQGSDPPISVRSAALASPIPLGATRHYQAYYRDPATGFCPPPSGDSWNASNALSAVWGP